MPGPSLPVPETYDIIRYLQFTEYTQDEYERVDEWISYDPFPTKVDIYPIPDYGQPFEVTISVLDESHGYPSEKDIAIKPGQLVVWLGGLIYIMSQMSTGHVDTSTYRYPHIEDLPTGTML